MSACISNPDGYNARGFSQTIHLASQPTHRALRATNVFHAQQVTGFEAARHHIYLDAVRRSRRCYLIAMMTLAWVWIPPIVTTIGTTLLFVGAVAGITALICRSPSIHPGMGPA